MGGLGNNLMCHRLVDRVDPIAERSRACKANGDCELLRTVMKFGLNDLECCRKQIPLQTRTFSFPAPDSIRTRPDLVSKTSLQPCTGCGTGTVSQC